MSADVLRQAAALMRERAEAAVPGPWPVDDDNHLALPMAKMPFAPEIRSARYTANGPEFYELAGPNDATTRHIASWHPAVALLVADWLEECWERPNFATPKALAVARAYLGSDTG